MNLFSKLHELSLSGKEFVVVTMLATKGHVPQDPGAKALVTSEGLFAGTVGGGRVEAKAIDYAKSLIIDPTKKIETHTWNLQKDVGMSCGGEVQFLFEVFRLPVWKVAVFGAGHVAQSLIPLLLKLDCQVTCIDNRTEWIERLPKDAANLKIIFCKEYPEVIPELHPDTFCAVMTRGHATDLPVLESLLKNGNFPYIGVIGSPIKAKKIKHDLKMLNLPEEKISQVHSPIGLPIGNNNHPVEIAISIAAQLIQQKEVFLASLKTTEQRSKPQLSQ